MEKEPKVIEGSHQRPSFLVALPTLGMVPIEFLVGFSRLQMPVNCRCESLILSRCEVGAARNHAAKTILEMKPRPKYLCFVGDDMIPPWDGIIKLWQEMETGKWDILAGLYYIKQRDLPIPIAWRTNVDGWLEPYKHYQPGEAIWTSVAGMDFTLIKPEVFEKIEYPWFETGPGHLPGKEKEDTERVDPLGLMEGITVYTEDVYFSRKASLAGLSIGVHTGVRVSHLDVSTGEIY